MSTGQKRSGLFFAGSTLAAGGIHYFFQLAAAKNLTQEQFGSLSSWIAYVTVILVIGSFCQYLSNFFPLSGKRLKRTSMGLLGVISILFFAPMFIRDEQPFYIVGLLVVFMGPIFAWLSGQVQARMLFYTLGIGAVLGALFKIGVAILPVPFMTTESQFYWAFVYGFGPPSAFLLFRLWRVADETIEHRSIDKQRSKKEWVEDLTSTFVLSFLAVFIPGMDIMVMDWTQDQMTLGLFARIALIYKVIFFGLFIFSQWLLPQQMSNEKLALKNFIPSWWKTGIYASFLAIFVATVCTVAAPYLADLALGFDLYEYREWIFLTCFNITILKASFFCVQDMSASGRPLKGFIATAFLILEWVTFANLGLNVTSYLWAVTGLHFLMFIWLISPIMSSAQGLAQNGFTKTN